MTLTIWHNPRCSKSRRTLALIEEAGIEPSVRLYLDDAPSVAELAEALELLGMEPWELARMGEPLAKETGLSELSRDGSTRDEWIRIMSANPKLIERPVVIAGDGRARLGRPPESVGDLLPPA
jgi:arsenate reductase